MSERLCPNHFVDVREEDLPDLFELLANIKKRPKDLERFAKYGVNRVYRKEKV